MRTKFNITKAQDGAELITRDGRPARFLSACYASETYPVLAEIGGIAHSFTPEGKLAMTSQSPEDLFVVRNRPTLKKRIDDALFHYENSDGCELERAAEEMYNLLIQIHNERFNP